MNFLYRATQPELPRIPEQDRRKDGASHKQAKTLEGLIADDPYRVSAAAEEDGAASNNGIGEIAGDASPAAASSDSKSSAPAGKHSDVSEDEGWITIPDGELPENWSEVSDMLQLRPLDRSFLFPGEQVHILACLSASKQDTQFISPFRIAAVMSKIGNSPQHPTKKSSPVNENGDANGTTTEDSSPHDVEDNNMESVELSDNASPSTQDVLETESLLRMEDHKQQIENMLEKFKRSNYFVRIAESDEPLWSKKRVAATKTANEQSYSDNLGNNMASRSNAYNTISDKGFFDGSTSGVTRDTARCYALHNGDIVVVLQVNVGVSNMEDPVLEVLQFEKCTSSNYMRENLVNRLPNGNEDPCRELLSWLLPLDRTLSPPCSLSPPTLNPSMSHKQSAPGSQIFSLSNFRSYSMPSASSAQPSNIRPPPISESQEFMPEQPAKTPDVINDGQLSFRGVPLEPERYSVRCGLEGVYLPGKRWSRKVEIIQPIEVHSFSAKCTAENLLCVLIKNIAPQHVQDIVVFIDAITVVFEEASKGGSPLSLPIASIEVGHGHNLPNLALRRGEEHSFILKPAIMSSRNQRTNGDATPTLSLPKTNGAATNASVPRVSDPSVPLTDQYAVLISYRCNYTESKLFFKQATSWQPCAASDLMISVSSELSLRNPTPSARVPQLPVQVLTLEATNMTSENLTLTVLAPEASGSSSVVSLNSAPTTPNGSHDNLNESARKSGLGKQGTGFRRLNSVVAGSLKESDNGGNRLSTSAGCTHLWLQSAVPLGCVPARSSTTVKLELLPLTDGIITLDTLQITIKEKGLTYIPENSLEIHASSGISAGRS
ncbi:hypothetical protein ACQ4PT_025862 [Festuca glaucescens]